MSQRPTDPASPYANEPAQPVTGVPSYDPYAPQQYPPPQYQPPQYLPQPYAPPGYYAAPPLYDPWGRPYSDKNKLVAGLLGVVLGGFGVGRFYTGHTGLGVAQLLVTLFTCGLGHFWGLIDGVMILVNGGTDAQGRILRER